MEDDVFEAIVDTAALPTTTPGRRAAMLVAMRIMDEWMYF
jgi:hypothetical protein